MPTKSRLKIASTLHISYKSYVYFWPEPPGAITGNGFALEKLEKHHSAKIAVIQMRLQCFTSDTSTTQDACGGGDFALL